MDPVNELLLKADDLTLPKAHKPSNAKQQKRMETVRNYNSELRDALSNMTLDELQKLSFEDLEKAVFAGGNRRWRQIGGSKC